LFIEAGWRNVWARHSGPTGFLNEINQYSATPAQGRPMTTRLHRGDLPDLSRYPRSGGVDTQAMGRALNRHPPCVAPPSPGDGRADVVQIPPNSGDAPNLKRLLGDPSVVKIFHFARFDIAQLFRRFGVMPAPVYCTKIASRLTRTYTDRHGLKDLTRDLL